MATLSHAESRRMYSWWWDSHISPKNSKWLQENLTDMDAKVKAMIKLIEEDADSFARRAEMYYKKRPELMKLVEEFYRAYRALAERYDHATGALRQAHRTIAEAFPNQVPPVLTDESPASSVTETDPRTPELMPPIHSFFDSDEFQKDVSGLSAPHFQATKGNDNFTEESDSVTSRKGLKQLNDLFGSGDVAPRARKVLNFHETEEKEQSSQNSDSHNLKARVMPVPETPGISENDIQTLKEALSKLEAEKDASFFRYQQSLERLSNLESEVSLAQENSRGLNDRASKAEAEVQALKEALAKLEAEREASLLQYQQCVDRICNLENSMSHAQAEAGDLNERASKAELEAQALKQDIARLEAEKDVLLIQHKQSLEMKSNLENQLLHAEEKATRTNEQANKADSEVKTLKQALAILTEEKDAAALLCQQYIEKISSLECEISHAQEEVQRLNGEIDSGIVKLKGAEERCHMLERSNQSLHSEFESLVMKMGTQSQELTEKQKELGRLWTCIQEERLRFMEAETAFQTLQHMHAQSQEELRSLASELQNRAQFVEDIEAHNQKLQDEVLKFKEENRNLNELNISSVVSIKTMQDEICSLKETKGQLEEEVGLRVDQRNALQQEIFCLKEEINDLNKKLRDVLEQVDSVGLNPECFGPAVKELQDENSNLKDITEKERNEKVMLLEKLEILDKALEKNKLLENSLSDLSAELEGVRGRVKALEESYLSLLGEKSSIVAEKGAVISQLMIMTDKLEKLSEKNVLLENSLSDALAELEGLRAKLKSLEDSYLLLDDEKSGLISERDTLASQFEVTRKKLEDLENRHTKLEERHSGLEKEKESALHKIEELWISLDVEKQEHARFSRSSESRLAGLETQIQLLREDGWRKKKEFEEEVDKAVNAQIEIFILQKCVQDLEENNFTLIIECQKLLEASKLSEKLISELQQENVEQQVEVKSSFDQIKKLRMGMYQIYWALDFDKEYGCADEEERDQMFLNHIIGKVEVTKNSLCKTFDENQRLIIENSVILTLLGQLRLEAAKLKTEKNTLDQEFGVVTEQFLMQQSETLKLLQMNEELRLKVREGGCKEKLLTTDVEDVRGKLSDLLGAYQNLQRDNLELLQEKSSLMRESRDLRDEKCALEEQNSVVLSETLYLSNLSLILMNVVAEKSVEQKKLVQGIVELHGIKNVLEGIVRMLEEKLELENVENLHLKESLLKSETELKEAKLVCDQLNLEIVYGKDLLCLKEVELSESEQKLSAVQNEKAELHKAMEDLRREYNEVKVIRVDQEKQIIELSENCNQQNEEIGCLRNAKWGLEAELSKLCKENEDTKVREESLNSYLEKSRYKIEQWESEAAAFFGELQVSAVHEALFKEKLHELTELCKSFKDKSDSEVAEIQLLKERVCTLKSENGGLKVQFASYAPAVAALRDCISSLENHTLLHTKFHEAVNEKAQDAEAIHPHAESCHNLSEDQIARVLDGLPDLQELQMRIIGIDNAVMEMERLAVQENLNANAELVTAKRQIEELKFKRNSRRENIQTSKHGPSEDSKLQKPTPEIQNRASSELLTKDIMLDHISEAPSYGMSKKEITEADDQLLEFWETIDKNGSIDLTVGKIQKKVTSPSEYHQIQAVEEHKNEHPFSEIMAEKELGVDKLEISKSFRDQPYQEGNKRKILERLASDAQKLANLQITVQDLKKKVEISVTNKKGKGHEYETVKGQLEEAEEAIVKLFDVNCKLVKNIEENISSPNGKSAELKKNGSVRRRRVTEQAQRGSEKIGRLQLEMQRIQFILLKLDGERESKARLRVPERKTKVVLRDYLYGGIRTGYRRKKTPFCSCVQPPTRGD